MSIKHIFASRKLNQHNDNDALSCISRNVKKAVCIDRFGYLNKYSKWDIVGNDKLPKIIKNYSENTFKEICLARGYEFIQKYKDKKIAVMWSGGLDSTTLICSLILNNIDRSRLVILHTKESVEEYPYFYTYLRTHGYTIFRIGKKTYEQFLTNPKYYLTSGSCGDELFSDILYYSHPEQYNLPWKDYARTFCSDEAIEQLDEARWFYNIEPFQLSQNLYFFYNFMSRYNTEKLSVGAITGNYENTINFYDTQEFQDFAYTRYLITLDNKTIPTNKDYKKEAKLLIYELLKDNDYLYKGKQESRQTIGIWYNTHFTTLIVDDNDTTIYKVASSEEYDSLVTYLNQYRRSNI